MLEGESKGHNDICQLIQLLTEANRTDDIQKLAVDSDYCDKLLEEFGIVTQEG